jgi:hypothetical protein
MRLALAANVCAAGGTVRCRWSGSLFILRSPGLEGRGCLGQLPGLPGAASGCEPTAAVSLRRQLAGKLAAHAGTAAGHHRDETLPTELRSGSAGRPQIYIEY